MSIVTKAVLCSSFTTQTLLSECCFFDFIGSADGVHQDCGVSMHIYPKLDGVVTGGTRGACSVDFQTARTTCDQVAAATLSVIGGGHANKIHSSATGGIILGGGCNTIDSSGQYSFIGGGYANCITDGFGTILGGCQNCIHSCYGTLLGGGSNVICTSSRHSLIGGGYNNKIESCSPASVILGGYQNQIGCTLNNCCACYAVILGGCQNKVMCQFGVVTNGAGNISCGFGAAVGGLNSISSGSYSFAYGECVVSSGCLAFVFGNCSCSTGTYSAAFGKNACAAHRVEIAFSNGMFTNVGDAQHGYVSWFGQTTSATEGQLYLDGSSAKFIIPNNSSYAFHIHIVAYKSNVTAGNSNAYFVTGAFKRVNGNLSFLSTLQEETVIENDAAWGYNLTLNNSDGSFEVKVTGAASNTIEWYASMEYVRVVGT